MRTKRCLALIVTVGIGVVVNAQFNGPAPLAWRWAQPTSVAPVGSPVVDGATAFVAVGDRMYAIDKETGNQKWRFPIGEPLDGRFKYGLMVAGNSLIAAADNHAIYCVNAETGQLNWTYTTPAPLIGPPALTGKTVTVAMADNTLEAVDLVTGQPTWKTPTGESAPYKVFDGIRGRITGYGNSVIFFTGNDEMRCVEIATQKTSWRQRGITSISPDTPPSQSGDNFLFVSGSMVGSISALSGRFNWTYTVGEGMTYNPAVSTNGVMVVTREGNAWLLNPRSGQPIQRTPIKLPARASSSPSAIGDLYSVPLANGSMVLIDPKAWKIVWNYTMRPLVRSASGTTNTTPGGRNQGSGQSNNTERQNYVLAAGPAVASGSTMLVLAQDGSVFAFDKTSGVDLTGPTVQMVWPYGGDMVSTNPPFEMIFKVEDDASGINLDTLKVTADNQPLLVTFDREGYALVKFSTVVPAGMNVNDPYSVKYNKPLPGGKRMITVTVSDWLGNETVEKFYLAVDNTMRVIPRPGTGTNEQGGAGGPGGPGGGPGGLGTGGGRRGGGSAGGL